MEIIYCDIQYWIKLVTPLKFKNMTQIHTVDNLNFPLEQNWYTTKTSEQSFLKTFKQI